MEGALSSANTDSLTIRMPMGMRDRLRRSAAINRRSMNAEIVHYIDRALAADETKGPAEAATSPGHVSSHSVEEKADERRTA